MADVPDHTKLIHMNLPGTHDTCTCRSAMFIKTKTKSNVDLTGNYTLETQKSLERYTGP